ncbi:hypothetical protein D3C81_1044180 [compost metagenome]
MRSPAPLTTRSALPATMYGACDNSASLSRMRLLSRKLLIFSSGMVGIASAIGVLRTVGDSLMVPREAPRLSWMRGWPST